MKKLFMILILGGLLVPVSLRGQTTPKEKGLEVITMDAIKAQLEFLASDWTEGRETGKRGIFLAGDYVASMFKFSGVQPAGDMARPSFNRMRRGSRVAPGKSYFQNFTLLETLPGGESSLKIKNGELEYVFQDRVDFMINRASASTELTGQLVFIGYGIKSEEFGIDDFAGADLKGKIAVRLSGYPGINDRNSEMNKKFMENRMAAYMLSRGKNEILEELGAVAVIDINPSSDIGNYMGVFIDDFNLSSNESSRNPAFTRLSLYSEEFKSSPVNISVTNKVANFLLKGSGIDIEKFESEAAAGNTKFKPVVLKNVFATVATEVKQRRVNVRNVVAMIEGENRNEFIVIGAHMDHMGMNGGRVWNGADDNASGTVGVLAIARAFASTGVKPAKSVIFCAWTGEEKGLLGSTYFNMDPSYGSIDQCKFYMNFDMISRDATNDSEGLNVGVTYNKNYPKLEEISRKNAEEYGLKMNFEYKAQDHPTGGSDYTAFTESDIPIIAVMAAMHPEYHTPGDHISLVNWDKMLEIIKLGFLNMWDIANSDL